MKVKRSSRENLVVVLLVFLCVVLFIIATYFTSGRSIIISGGVAAGTGAEDSQISIATKAAAPKSSPQPSATVDFFIQSIFEAIQHRPKGMGISRAQIQPAYEKEGFVFQEDTALDGQARSAAATKYGMALVELFGPADNLTRTSVTVSLKDAPPELVAHFGYMLKMVALVAPDWKEGPGWFQTSLTKLNQANQDNYTEETTLFKNIRIRIRIARPFGLISLTCEGVE